MDADLLKNIHPLNTLSPKAIQALAKGMQVQLVKPGAYIFRTGDTVYDTLYVLEGRVDFLGSDGKLKLSLGKEQSKGVHPFPHEVPSKYDARAADDVKLLKVDSQLLSSVLSWDQPSGIEVGQLGATEPAADWMSNFLATRGFGRVPPAKLHTVFMKMQAADLKAGEIVIKQGTEGDCFFVVAQGRVVVEREAPNLPQPVKLAEFGPGACFGEDSLISGSTRNATVRMLTDGKLMKLTKADFIALLKTPLIPEVSFEQAQTLLAKGGQWLDVRMPNEVVDDRVDGSLNIPFPILRTRLASLPEGKPYIVFCKDGRNSSTATFLLSKQGLDAYYLRGGVASIAKKA